MITQLCQVGLQISSKKKGNVERFDIQEVKEKKHTKLHNTYRDKTCQLHDLHSSHLLNDSHYYYSQLVFWK